MINNRLRSKTWFFISLVALVLVLIPFVFLFITLFAEKAERWSHIAQYLLSDYFKNTFAIIGLSSVFALLLAVPQAWFVSAFNFKGKHFFSLALVLPITIPAYIMAFTYSGILDYTGIYGVLVRYMVEPETAQLFYFDEKNILFVSFMYALALSPYIFISAKIAFKFTGASYLEASELLGIHAFKRFFKIILPVAFPAIFGGLLLLIMEVLNDYGAVKYYGINTFTTGIFRAWFDFGDLASAGYLSVILLGIVLFFVAVEKFISGLTKIEQSGKHKAVVPKKSKGFFAFICVISCFIPFFLGFLVPLTQLLYWAVVSVPKVNLPDYGVMILNSFGVAFIAGLSIVVLAIIFLYAERVNRGNKGTIITKLSALGYAIPGAVIAIGALSFAANTQAFFSMINVFLSGSFVLIVLAYVSRFMAVGINPIEDAFAKNSINLHYAGRLMGMSSLATLFRIEMPLLRNAIASGAILVFIDVLKELPLTLILRPFNFDSLATKAFELANDELIAQAAIPSVCIIFVSIIPVLILNKIAK